MPKQKFSDLAASHRPLYDAADKELTRFKAKPGLTEELVRQISKQKNEPSWMLEKRLQGFLLFQKTPLPAWGPDLTKLDLDAITYFVRPDTEEAKRWEDVPDTSRKRLTAWVFRRQKKIC